MKKLVCFSLGVLASLAAIGIGVAIGYASLEPERPCKPHIDEAKDFMHCRELSIDDEQGNCQIHLTADPTHRGIWINGQKKGQFIGIYSTPNQRQAFTIADVEHPLYPQNPSGFQFALALNDQGMPCLQFMGHDGRLHWVEISSFATPPGCGAAPPEPAGACCGNPR